ncbi:hypothetical protein SAMD00019534_034630, partial [Acytostelium subglobosum LB1]|uniref:hypothetical protein n=1 Tax=Acytostelium subglobosum LB1 TaxID=1410327 RepID=UPI00064498F1
QSIIHRHKMKNKTTSTKQSSSLNTSKQTSIQKNRKYAFVLALIGGVFASLSSVFGKIVVDTNFLSLYISQEKVDYAIRLVSFAGIFICTTMQWRYSAKSMDLSSSLSATVIATASNFFFSAFFGWLFFKEFLAPQWWIGATFIVTGLFLMNADSEKQPQPSSSSSKKNK